MQVCTIIAFGAILDDDCKCQRVSTQDGGDTPTVPIHAYMFQTHKQSCSNIFRHLANLFQHNCTPQ